MLFLRYKADALELDMDGEDVKGLIIFSGIFVTLAFVTLGCMGRQLAKVEKALKIDPNNGILYSNLSEAFLKQIYNLLSKLIY